MTCLRACGSGHTRCSPEATALHARRISGSAAGPSNQNRPHPATQPGRLQSQSRRSRRSQHLSAVAPAEFETPARSQLTHPVDWQHLEAMLDSSNQYPLSAYSPWRAGLPDALQSSTLQQLLRPVGGLLHLAVQLEERPPAVQNEDEERRKRQNYYANVGDAVRTLREEIPLLFQRDLTCEPSPCIASIRVGPPQPVLYSPYCRQCLLSLTLSERSITQRMSVLRHSHNPHDGRPAMHVCCRPQCTCTTAS